MPEELQKASSELSAPLGASAGLDAQLPGVTRALSAIALSTLACARRSSESELLFQVCRAITEQGLYPFAWIAYSLQDAARRIQLAAWAGADEDLLLSLHAAWENHRSAAGPTGKAIASGVPHVQSGRRAKNNTAFDPSARLAEGTAIALPVRLHGTVIGALTIYAHSGSDLGQEEQLLLKRLADDLSAAIGMRRSESEQDPAAQLLHSSEEQFKAIFELAAVGMARVAPDGRWLEVNDRLCQILGYSRGELLRMRVIDLYDPGDVQLYELYGNRVRSGEQSLLAMERGFIRKDGSKAWTSVHTSVVRDPGGEQVYRISVVQDISEKRQQEEALRASESAFRSIFDQSVLGIAIEDLDGRFQRVNDSLCRMLGYRREDLLGLSWQDVSPAEEVSTGSVVDEGLRADPNRVFAAEKRYRRRDGSIMWGHLTLSVQRDASGAPKSLLAMIEDVTERVLADARAKELGDQYRRIMEIAQEGMLLIDAEMRITFANRQLADLLGYREDELIGISLLSLLSEEEAALRRSSMEGRRFGSSEPWQYDSTLLCKDGSEKHFLVSTVGLYDQQGTFTGAFAMMTDVTERRRSEQRLQAELRRAALHDALTGLPNRTLLNDRIEQEIRRCMRSHTSLAVLLLDLDRFKDINDAFGHFVGDGVLCQVAERLGTPLRASDTVARLGGDEFAVLLPEDDAHSAYRTAAKVRAALEEPLLADAHQVQIDVSVGIALFPEHGDDAVTLLRRADVAMYVAKQTGAGVSVYQEDQDRHSRNRLELTQELRNAIRERQLVLHYQPQIALRSGELVGLEALTYWLHPQRGLLPPDQFIDLAEQTGQMAALTDFVLQSAVQQLHNWACMGRMPVQIAINISATNLRDVYLPEQVGHLLVHHNVSPLLLRVEVTESMLMSDQERARETIAQLARMGVGISIDDFGTGYSNLKYLTRLAVDELKIDRSFIGELATNPAQATIVASTVALGHGLGLRVVAEGVEDQAVWLLLKELGCDIAQGYHLARPMTVQQLDVWLVENGHLATTSD